MTTTSKNSSPFVQAALALDEEIQTFDQLTKEIEILTVGSDKGLDKAPKLLTQFDECRQRIGARMQDLGQTLEGIRIKMEASTEKVSSRAEEVEKRQREAQQMLERFKMLGSMVREVTTSVSELCQKVKDGFSDTDRNELKEHLPDFNNKLGVLVDEARQFLADARQANMKSLEQSADSLHQSLQAARNRLNLVVTQQENQNLH